MTSAILEIIDLIFTIYLWSLLILVIASWLITFDIINPYQPMVRMVLTFLRRVHEPILAPIRRMQYRLLPNSGGLDLSPIFAILIAQYLVLPILIKLTIAIFS
jgi:YggT family protein